MVQLSSIVLSALALGATVNALASQGSPDSKQLKRRAGPGLQRRQLNIGIPVDADVPVAAPINIPNLAIAVNDVLNDLTANVLTPGGVKRDSKTAAADAFKSSLTDYAKLNGLPVDGLTPTALTGLVATVLSLLTTLLAGITNGLALPLPLPLPAPGSEELRSAITNLALANGLPIGGLDPAILTGLLSTVIALLTTLLGGLLGGLPVPLPTLPGLPL